jgi:UDP-glucuronate decarboxylase
MDPQDGRVVSNFIMQALRGEDITIYGSGEQSRSFCYVDDMIDALILLMETDDSFTGPVNLGNPEEMSMLDLASMVLELTGSSSGITFRELPEDDPMQRQPDISLAKKVLRWQPETEVREGLKHTIDYFRQLMSAEQ